MPLNEKCRLFAIGSGKGGVGKSTVAINFAVALAQKGYHVGLLDADIFGPSIPIMMGLRNLSPKIERQSEGKEQIFPFTKFGIQVMSIGFFVEEARPMIWRGPVLHATLQKMIDFVAWGELDFLFIDLPPGTGDTLLSLSQLLKIEGGIIVCTPQEVAALDALKAINAFYQLDIPTAGIIENMAGFFVPETKQIYHVFGQGKVHDLARRFNLPLLAHIPLIAEIRQGSDEGQPPALFAKEQAAGQHFHILAQNFLDQCIKPVLNPFTINA
jgi:ATP-binding protein involved in chromosome partitioning